MWTSDSGFQFIFITWSEETYYHSCREHSFYISIGFAIPKVPSCRKPMGMESGRILNSSITASTGLPGYPSYKARLNTNAGWFAAKQNPNQWLQVDFGSVTQVTAISTQGYYYGNSWVKSYTLSYSNTGLEPFRSYHQQSLKKVLFINSVFRQNGVVYLLYS